MTVDGSGDGYRRTVCDYVPWNPARAELLSPQQFLREYGLRGILPAQPTDAGEKMVLAARTPEARSTVKIQAR